MHDMKTATGKWIIKIIGLAITGSYKGFEVLNEI